MVELEIYLVALGRSSWFPNYSILVLALLVKLRESLISEKQEFLFAAFSFSTPVFQEISGKSISNLMPPSPKPTGYTSIRF